jgi:hypothetical protein
MKKSRRGHMVLERSVYPIVQKMCSTAGWTTKRIPKSESELSDTAISIKYGKGIAVLLTSDKTAYTNNTQKGFKGYIVQNIPIEKKDFNIFLNNMGKVLSSYTSKTLKDYQITVGTELKKEKITK